jgi:hypothetical protein
VRQAVRASKPSGKAPHVDGADARPGSLIVPAFETVELVNEVMAALANCFFANRARALVASRHVADLVQDDLDRAAVRFRQVLPGTKDRLDFRFIELVPGQVELVMLRLKQILEQVVRYLPQDSLRVKCL